LKLWSRPILYVASVGAHAALGAVVGSIPTAAHHDVVAISIVETKAAKAPVIAPPPEDPAPSPAAQARPPARAAVSKPATPPRQGTSAGGDSLSEFGVSLSGGTGVGVALPAAGGLSSADPVLESKTLTHVPRGAEPCSDLVGKPKVVSRSVPVYTAEARAASVSGKVRVELTVDDHGRVAAVRLVEKLGFGLDEAAVAAARAMTFEPPVRCGKTVSSTFKIGFSFAPSPT
jgi:periplasmic protein TonB